MITEGTRFPRIAEFYHREVIANGLAIVKRLAQRAMARGEPPVRRPCPISPARFRSVAAGVDLGRAVFRN